MAKIKKTSVSALKKQNAAIKKAASAPGATKTKGGVMKTAKSGTPSGLSGGAAKKVKGGWVYSPAKGGTPPGTLKGKGPTGKTAAAFKQAMMDAKMGKASKAPGKSTNWANYDKSGGSKAASWAKGYGSKSTPSANYKKYWAMKKQ